MIGKNVQNFCCEDISLIENYEQAISDKTQTWDCHHRSETDLGLSRDELIERNLYYDRPASELIFMTHSDHIKLHNHGEKHPMYGKRGKDSPMYGKRGKDAPFYNKHHSEETKKKQSENSYSPLKGTHPTWMNNGIRECRPKTQEEIEHYIELGYDFGRK